MDIAAAVVLSSPVITSTELSALNEQSVSSDFDLTQIQEDGDAVTKLSIPKYRGGTIPAEPIKLDLTEGIRIDQSRDIS